MSNSYMRQYIKILTRVCVCVCVCVTEVGCSWGRTRLVTHDLRTSYFNLLNLELCEECSRTSGPESSRAAGECNHGAAIEADTIGEQKLKQTQSGSSSRSRCNRGAAAEADAKGELLT